jgi:predicted membrane protein
MAFVLSGVLYLVAGFATSVASFDTGLNVFLAWLTCAVAAVGTYATVQHGGAVIRGENRA